MSDTQIPELLTNDPNITAISAITLLLMRKEDELVRANDRLQQQQKIKDEIAEMKVEVASVKVLVEDNRSLRQQLELLRQKSEAQVTPSNRQIGEVYILQGLPHDYHQLSGVEPPYEYLHADMGITSEPDHARLFYNRFDANVEVGRQRRTGFKHIEWEVIPHPFLKTYFPHPLESESEFAPCSGTGSGDCGAG